MKKNIRLNKQIIKALSVGISASMLLQPVTAFADELETTPATTPAAEGTESTTSKTAYEATEEVADEASTAVNTAIVSSNEAVAAVVDEDATAKVVEAKEGLNEAISNNEAELRQDIVDAKADVVAMDEKAIEIAADVSAAEKLAGEANQAAVSANDAVDAGNLIADTVDVSVNEAITSVSQNEAALLKAGTTDEANAIYGDIEKTINDTNEEVNAADGELAALETDYNTAKGIYDAKEQAYNDILGELAIAQAAYDALKDDAAGDEGETQDALTRLETLKTEAARLQAEAQAAYDQFTKSGYGLIAKYEMMAKDPAAYGVQNSQKWGKILDPLFNTIMKVHYVPEVISTEENKCTFVKAEWHKFGSKDELNYCVVTYKDADGKTHTEILDYRLDNENKDGGLVIFEKTPHVIMGDVDLTGEELDILNNAPAGQNYIIKTFGDQQYIIALVDGQYVVYDGNDKEPTVDVSANTTGSTENGETETKVEISNENTVYTFEDGKLIKTVYGDVTTTVSTGARLDALANVKEKEEDARAAYVAALRAKLDALNEGEVLVIGETEIGKDYVIDADAPIGYVSTYDSTTETVTTGYTTTATYVKKFTDKVDIDSGWHLAEAAADAAYWVEDKAVKGTLETKHLLDRVVSRDSDSSLEKAGRFKYKRSGYVSYEYLDITTETTKFSLISDSLSDAKAEAKKWVEDQGGIFIDFYGFDFKYKKGTIVYIEGHTVTGTAATAAAAEAAAAAQAGSAVYNYKYNTVANTTDVETKTYGYAELAYIIKSQSVSTGEVISTTEWADILGNATLQYKNDKFDKGEIILAEYDYTDKRDYVTDAKEEKNLESKDVAQTADFRKKVDRAAEVANMYLDTVEKSKSAVEAIEAAKAKVQELENEIKKLTAEGASITQINAIKGDLAAARAKLEAAKAKRDDLVKKLDDIKIELQQKIDELTPPSVTPVNPNPNPVNPTEEIPQLVPVAPVLFTAPAAPVVVAEIPEDEVPQVEAPVVEEPVEVAEIEDDDTALAAAPITVGDDATPLASIPDAKEMSWWWLLIVLILGATGAEMYRRHMAKKKAAEVNSTDVK